MRELVIAAGTPAQITVLDVRDDYPWSRPSGAPVERAVYYHHTADLGALGTDLVETALAACRRMAASDKYGLPYSFLVWPLASVEADFPVFYLNDFDVAHPHTFGHNGAIAVAAQGNYDIAPPPPNLAHRMGAVTWALGTMLGVYLPERFHRDVFPTACPGRYLASALAADGSYSG